MSSLNIHPLIDYASGYNTIGMLPPQSLLQREKDDDWRKKNMDFLEAVGRNQFWNNMKLRENYRMLNGEFLSYQYEDSAENEYVSLLDLAKEYTDKNLRLRHFDFIKQAVNTLLGEFEAHPDTFKAKAVGDTINTEQERLKAQMLLEYVQNEINQRIDQQLRQQGLDPDKQDFASEEEQAQYQQQVQQQKQVLTPPEIENYVSTKWQHVAEKWANIQLEVDKYEHHRPRLSQREFRDMLVSDRCFRHFYTTGTGYGEETWNPLETFFHVSPNVYEVEKGSFAGRILFRSLPDIIDRYGHLLTGKELNELVGTFGQPKPKNATEIHDWMGNKIDYLDVNGLPYASRLPTDNRWMLEVMPQVSQVPSVSTEMLFAAPGRYQDDYRFYINNIYQVTEAYWKSQKRVGKLIWFDPLSGEIRKDIVDDSVVLPENTREVEGNLYDHTDPDEEELLKGPIVQWTWINEVWGGVKITPLSTITKKRKHVYLNVNPLDFQGKGDAKIYDCELPVVGEIFNNRNAISQSLVDLMKPYQIFYNLMMNQSMIIAEEEILPFLLMDANSIPNQKDWGGPEGWFKWIESVRATKVGFLDNRPQQTQGANAGGQLPAVINLDASTRMLTRFQLAQQIKQLALEQVGLNPQRLASVQAGETATGVQTAMQQSYTQTSSYFTRFYQYEQRCLQKGLSYAQYVQSRNEDITVSAIHSDYSRAFLQLNRTDLLAADFKVFVQNAQKEVQRLEMVRQLALENNTVLTTMSDRIDMVTTDSIQTIRDIVKNSELHQEKLQQQSQQLEEQKLQQATEEADKQRAFDAEQNQLDRDAKLQEAYIKTFGYGDSATVDTDSSGVPDALEYEKLSQKAQSEQSKLNLQERKLEQDRIKVLNDNLHNEQKMQLEREKMRSNQIIAEKKLASSKVLGDKSK